MGILGLLAHTSNRYRLLTGAWSELLRGVNHGWGLLCSISVWDLAGCSTGNCWTSGRISDFPTELPGFEDHLPSDLPIAPKHGDFICFFAIFFVISCLVSGHLGCCLRGGGGLALLLLALDWEALELVCDVGLRGGAGGLWRGLMELAWGDGGHGLGLELDLMGWDGIHLWFKWVVSLTVMKVTN